MTWEAGALPEGTHIMPWSIEDEVRKLGDNYIRAGAFRAFAIRNGNLVTSDPPSHPPPHSTHTQPERPQHRGGRQGPFAAARLRP
jgi:hypothetical protein